jgi:FixJ family two-component response regulator
MSSTLQNHTRSPTVLVSDDEPAVRRALHLLLRSRGYQVNGYTTGTALLSDPNALSADCAILDYKMPDIDGFVILEHLRAQGWRGGAILITGYRDVDLIRRATEAGFAEILAKPLRGRDVLAAVACQCKPCGCEGPRACRTKTSASES